MADQPTIADLIHRAQDGEKLTTAEIERVAAWVRDDLGPAVRRANDVMAGAFTTAAKRIGEYLASPAGKQLVALAAEHTDRKHEDADA